MKSYQRDGVTLYDAAPVKTGLRDAAVHGLSQDPPSLPCKYFYDERGSELFDAICASPDYYVTRTEQGILDRHAAAMGEALGPGCRIVEPGSGSSTKTRALLAVLPRPAAYVPIDISAEHLFSTAIELNGDFPDLEVTPIAADYTQGIDLPSASESTPRTVVYFPGSTLGNFSDREAAAFLTRIRGLVGDGGALLIGVDRVKDADVLYRAYNDRDGITAEFNRNVLDRLRGEPDTELDPQGFRHEAVWQPEKRRIEMRLIAVGDQTIRIGEHRFVIPDGHHIVTEHSHKYTEESFAELVAQAGFTVSQVWTDADEWFAVSLLL